MLPTFLIRATIDWIRHDSQFEDSNPYSRCVEALKMVNRLWQEEFGRLDNLTLEPAVLIAYWEEFLHAEDPLPDEVEWRDGLKKHSSPHDNYDNWEKWFKENYAAVYENNDIWKCVMMSAWAETHQFIVRYQAGNWRFLSSKSYLPTAAMWSLEPHIPVVRETLRRVLDEELKIYSSAGFEIKNEAGPIFGNLECVGFDSRIYSLYFPAHSQRDRVNLDYGTMVADIVAPIGNEWYRQLDHVIFAENFVDTNMVSFTFTSSIFIP